MIGTTISHYTIIEKLGSGGMGDVYKAEDTKLRRTVALKFLPPEFTRNDESRERFVHEARAASALDHPNIGTIYEINDDHEGQFFIAMAYYEGQTLKEKIESGPLDVAEAVDIAGQISNGLAKAHEKEIIHRDIKPANIMLTEDGQVKIIDFGLAKLRGQSILTKTGTTLGTVAYMSPEQAQGDKVDHRSDIWSVGVMLYEMLAGERPFKGEYEQAIMYLILNEEPEFISKVRKDVPVSLEKVLEMAMVKNPGKRYQTVNQMATELAEVREEFTRGESSTSSIFKLGRRQRRYLFRFIAIILIMAIAGIYLWQSRRAAAEPVSLVLLPLKSISQDVEQEWFTDGMTDALITDLAKISGLKVISRSSAMKYKGTDKTPPVIALELDVQYVIEASIVRIGDRIKISARLINALADEYLWAEEYERDFGDILGLQGEIAQAIAGQVQVELAPREKTQFAALRSIDPDAYELYLKGMYHVNKLTPDGIEKGLQYLQEAVEKDPEAARIHAGIASAYGLIAHTTSPTREIYERSRQSALKALEIDENLAEAHLELALTQIYYDRNITAAEQSYRRALDLNPSLADAHIHYGWFLLLMGEKDKAVESMKRAQGLDPLKPLYPAWLGYLYWWEGEFDKAIEEVQKSLELDPDFLVGLSILGMSYADKEMYEEAIEAITKANNINPERKFLFAIIYGKAGRKKEAQDIAAEMEKRVGPKETWRLALIYAAIGDKEKTFYWLDQAVEKRAPYILWFIKDGNFDYLRDDPRYDQLAQRLGLVD